MENIKKLFIEKNNNIKKAIEIINDENISQIDLARALIASGENEDEASRAS